MWNNVDCSQCLQKRYAKKRRVAPGTVEITDEFDKFRLDLKNAKIALENVKRTRSVYAQPRRAPLA
jgi:hypothetical protein